MLAEAATLIVCVFLLGGGVAFTMFILNPHVAHTMTTAIQLPYSPVAMFLLSLGVMGMFILRAASVNLPANPPLGKRQFYVGLSLVGVSVTGMQLLLNVVAT